jgi:hypothetical protein
MFIPPLSKGKGVHFVWPGKTTDLILSLKSNNIQDSSLVMETLFSKMSLETRSNLESGLSLRGMDLTTLRKFRQTM